MRYAGLWLGLFAFNVLVTLIASPSQYSFLALTCPGVTYTIPVAILVGQSRWGATGGLLASAVIAPLVGSAALWGILQFAPAPPPIDWQLVTMRVLSSVCVAVAGVPMGMGIAAGWSYSRTVAVVTATFFLFGAGFLAVLWHPYDAWINSMIASFEATVREKPESFAVSSEQLTSLDWIKTNKSSIAVGVQFAAYLVSASVLVTIAGAILRRRYADPGPVGSFRDMRPPDWLAWGAIATAVMWLIDYHFGNASLRFVSWNMAIGLLAVYALNGFAIFLYGVNALAPGFFSMALIVLLLINFGMVPVLSMIGLFDTWAEFRNRIDRLAEAIRNAQSGDGLT